LYCIQKSDIIITSLSQNKGKKMRKLFGRVKSQKGMSGVLVAMLLVVVGVGLVAGVNTFMTDAKDRIVTDANTSITDALAN
jgi:hypothetical protein